MYQESSLSLEAPHASWLTNKQLLSPLLVEYDHTISELNQQITTYQNELATLGTRVQEITEENTRLHSDLRQSLESQLKSSNGGSGGTVVEAVQEQMNILSRERDSYVDLWRQTSRELETLQSSERVSWWMLYYRVYLEWFELGLGEDWISSQMQERAGQDSASCNVSQADNWWTHSSMWEAGPGWFINAKNLLLIEYS